ncbi:MAG: cation:proton antiporter [Candidatus Bipolaricaulota bacterium]|nr:cation:proton antiporter [Candidatus Bipolaricaulota bacterium]MCS7273825.1 cation:proton antiporter [Candidatus Bipolaricaulota bacterium]MDW8110757.1 cation:proton antiporter [Candidatus Bipolaricaulota bacterium]MDW8328385.1 cation:proton antiporter [Candidatus Bipolaricaulota bacterium]
MLLQLGLILLVLYLGALVAHRLRQSSVPVFILAGLGVQLFVAHSDVIAFMAQLGAMLLLFTIGLDFSPERVRRSSRTIFVATGLDLLINLPLGILVGLVIGLDLWSALVLGGVLYNNSTSIIARLIIDFRRSALAETEYAVGVSVYQDLITALYLAVLAGLVRTASLDLVGILVVFAKTVGFFGGAFLAALLLRPVLQRLMAHESLEVFLLFVLAFMVVLAAVSEWLGLSGAIGAFFAGFILPEQEFRERLERVIAPFRDLFAAIFFVSFGMLLDLTDVGHTVFFVPVVLVVAIAGKLLTGMVIGRVVALGRAAAVRLGVTLLPRGEFSILLAGLAPEPSLLALTVTVVLVLALVGPLLMKWAS